jgi:hypothetical protein
MAFWTVKNTPLDIDVKCLVVSVFRDIAYRGELCDPGVGKQHIDPAQLLGNNFEQCVQVSQFADIGRYGQDAAPEFTNRGVERLLVAARDGHPGTHFLKQFCGSQADPAAAARDDCNFSL